MPRREAPPAASYHNNQTSLDKNITPGRGAAVSPSSHAGRKTQTSEDRSPLCRASTIYDD